MCCVFAGEVEPAGLPLNIPYRGDTYVAFGEMGEAVLTGDNGNIYLYQHDGVQYSLAKKASLPDGVGWDCNKAISSSTLFVQDFWSSSDIPTHLFHLPQLEYASGITVHHKGKLRGLLHSSTLVYSQERLHGRYTITLHRRDHAEITRLLPPRRQWSGGLSVAAAGAYLVVVDGYTKSMAIFTANGNILQLFCHMTSVYMNL